MNDLSFTECDILDLLSQGWSNAEIGMGMGYARSTVSNILASIYAKLGVKGRCSACRMWRERW